jgi:hypothetical protein
MTGAKLNILKLCSSMSRATKETAIVDYLDHELAFSIQICTPIEHHVRNGIDSILRRLFIIEQAYTMRRVVDTCNLAGQQLVLRQVSSVYSLPGIQAMRNVVTMIGPDNYLFRDDI